MGLIPKWSYSFHSMSFTNQHEWWIFPIQFLRNGFCYVIWHARKSCSKGHHISQKDRYSTFPVTENYPEQECQQTAVSDVLSNRQEFIWEQTINWVQNFIVLHKSDLLYKAISLNNNKPRPAAKLFSLEVQKNYFFFLYLIITKERTRTLVYNILRMLNPQIKIYIAQFYV